MYTDVIRVFFGRLFAITVIIGFFLAQPSCYAQAEGANANNGGAPTRKSKATSSSGPGQSTPTKPAPASGNVQFADLVAPADQQKPKLPYGQPFTITGNLADVCVTGKATRDATTNAISCMGGQNVSNILAATTVGGTYVVSGQETPFTVAKISGDSWSVTIGKLDENTPVTFKFSFSGKLAAAQVEPIIDTLFAANDFELALTQFIDTAKGKPADQQALFAQAFGQTMAQKVLDFIGTLHVTPTNPDDFRKLLSTPTPAAFGLLVNFPTEIDELRKLGSDAKQDLGFQDSMTPSQGYQALKAAMGSGRHIDPAVQLAAQRYIANYEALRNQFAITVAANLSLDVGTTADDITEDLKKYAGFDGGALYVPRLNELRAFATVNIYLGSVSLHPSNGTRNWFMERFSLTFGAAVKDLSGTDTSKTKIKGEDAFIYGVGLRLNKYFRLSAGGLVYRAQLPAVNGVASPVTNTLRNEFYIGPSLDVTAISALKGIFAKAKSN